MPHCVTVVVLSLALAATLAEAKAQHIHVTAQVVQQTFTGEFANPQLGDQLITSVVLLNEEAEEVGRSRVEPSRTSLIAALGVEELDCFLEQSRRTERVGTHRSSG